MAAANLIEFVPAAAVIVVAPGPDTLLVLRNSSQRGRRVGLITICGIVCGLAFWCAMAVLGLAAIVRASSVGYEIVRYAGAAYLSILGMRLLLRRRSAADDNPDTAAPPSDPRPSWHAFASGLATNLLNPKVGVFFVSFLPVFVPKGAPVAATCLGLGVIFIVMGTAWLVMLSLLSARLGRLFATSKIRRRMEQVTGLVMIGFGVRVAVGSR